MKNQTGAMSLGKWIGVLVLVFVVGGGIIWMMESDSSQGPTVSDVAKNPENYYGQQVSLKGEIEDIRSPRIFKLDQEARVAGDELLVLSIRSIEPQGGASDSSDLSSLNDQDVLVTGTLRRLVSADISKQTGIDLDPQLVVDFENKPVVIAREVEFLPENNRQNNEDY